MRGRTIFIFSASDLPIWVLSISISRAVEWTCQSSQHSHSTILFNPGMITECKHLREEIFNQLASISLWSWYVGGGGGGGVWHFNRDPRLSLCLWHAQTWLESHDTIILIRLGIMLIMLRVFVHQWFTIFLQDFQKEKEKNPIEPLKSIDFIFWSCS